MQNIAQALANDTVRIGNRDIAVWPRGQQIYPVGHRTIGLTTFADAAEINPRLVAKLPEIAMDPRFAGLQVRATGGHRLNHLERWETPEAELLNARALAMGQQLLGSETAIIDRAWANLFRRGDYIMPGSTDRGGALVVYCLEAGDDDPLDLFAGKLVIADARLEVCCPKRRDLVTNPLLPRLEAGSMLAFPSSVVHSVNAYAGERPRVLLFWSIDKEIIPTRTGETPL